ncbi:secreted RxLR effector protein 161-like [Rutidosis leptorrhynchoides]|uniref:secreted RxLR effector protein 161-like n=1 Tax=Rutidosis leptorrhynchoides TaxID=125765 RepID=UPI003A991974
MRFFLGIEVLERSDVIFICQRKYAREILERFDMINNNGVCNPSTVGYKLNKDEGGIKVDVTQFKQIIGSLMYLSATRPDIMFAVSLISRFMTCPTQMHFSVAKRILKYVKETMDYGVFYRRGMKGDLVGYKDSDYAGDDEDSRSTSGYVFMMSGGGVAWSSKKQPIVTLSSTEAESCVDDKSTI